jgi:hypothetical protein
MRSDDNSVSEVFVGVVYPKTLRDVQRHQTLFTFIPCFTFFLALHTTQLLEGVFLVG